MTYLTKKKKKAKSEIQGRYGRRRSRNEVEEATRQMGEDCDCDFGRIKDKSLETMNRAL
jgi:predicted CopG family antitoxin